mgnify:CR=1 FL=1
MRTGIGEFDVTRTTQQGYPAIKGQIPAESYRRKGEEGDGPVIEGEDCDWSDRANHSIGNEGHSIGNERAFDRERSPAESCRRKGEEGRS